MKLRFRCKQVILDSNRKSFLFGVKKQMFKNCHLKISVRVQTSTCTFDNLKPRSSKLFRDTVISYYTLREQEA